MGQAYTPGLRVSRRALLRRERRLPLKGEVLVKSGMPVTADTVVARTHLPGQVELVNVANKLGVDPKDVKLRMLKKERESVEKGEILARHAGLFGLFKSESISPISGFVETVSDVTGKVTLREHPIPVEIKAFVEGEIESILPDEGVVVRTWGSLVQGIFGIGGETWGPLRVAVESPEENLEESHLHEDHSGSIVLGGSRVALGALEKAVRLGVKGIIAGGIDDQDLRNFLGYDLGVAITGTEEKGVTLVVTEGFGYIRMALKTFEILKECEGRLTSVNGATQIRAGVIRPEIVVPFVEEGIPEAERSRGVNSSGLSRGSSIRIIREPYFGVLGKVLELPAELRPLETEANVRVVESQLENGKTWILPRANVEIIEE